MLKLLLDEHISLDGWLSPRKWISSLAWRGDAIPSRLKVSATCTLIVTPQRACLLQAHLVLEKTVDGTSAGCRVYFGDPGSIPIKGRDKP